MKRITTFVANLGVFLMMGGSFAFTIVTMYQWWLLIRESFWMLFLAPPLAIEAVVNALGNPWAWAAAAVIAVGWLLTRADPKVLE